MLKRKKELIAKLLVFAMFISMIPAKITFAAEKNNIPKKATNVIQTTGAAVSVTEEVSNELVNSIFTDASSFSFDSSTGTITKYDDYDARVAIPSTINGVKVTKVGDSAFDTYYGHYSVTSITIPDSVTSIGNKAFYQDLYLANITIPNSVTSLGDYAFYGCGSLKSLTLPNGITSIGNQAFYGCDDLISITIPNSINSIGDNEFYGCKSLKYMTIPNSVTSIGDQAFYKCSSLSSITIPNNVTSIGYNSFYGCSGATSLTISNSATSIGEGAFSGCSNLTSVTIPNSVTSIAYNAFYDCSKLTSITIPDSVTTIEANAFQDCDNAIFYVNSENTKQLLLNIGIDESKIILNTQSSTVKATGVTLDKSSLSLEKGKTSTLTATVAPTNASNKSVKWATSDNTVATVDEEGNISAVGTGTAIITCSSADGSNQSTTCNVTVKDSVVQATTITLNLNSLSLEKGKTSTLTATVAPTNASNKSVKWTTSDNTVATVDEKGNISAVGTGTAIITCSSTDGSNKNATCNVTVTDASTTNNSTSDKSDYTLMSLINDENTFNNILGKYTLDKLNVVIPKNYIQEIKITQNDTMKLSSFEVTADADNVDSVTVEANGKKYSMQYQGDGVYKYGVYNLPKGSEVIFNAYDSDKKLIDSSVQRLRTIDYQSVAPDKTQYTLEGLVDDLDLFNQILGNYTLDQIHVLVPQIYIKDVQIKYNSIATSINVTTNNGANSVNVQTKINGQLKTQNLKNTGNGIFEGALAGLQPGAEIKISVYKDNNLVDQVVKKITK